MYSKRRYGPGLALSGVILLLSGGTARAQEETLGDGAPRGDSGSILPLHPPQAVYGVT